MSHDIIIKTEGLAGRITLNRPEALNAITYDMLLTIEEALKSWQSDPKVRCVVIDAAGDKAFCAGGDIDEMYRTGVVGDYAYGKKFWQDEYRINAMIAHYSKPYIPIMHGFVMGGGVGVSCHGSHRVVTSSAKIAMPECAIGLVPDVGGSYLLGRAPDYLGEYLGMTGTRMNAADAIFAGFADCHIPDAAKNELIEALCETGDVSFLETYAKEPAPGTLSPDLDAINATFGKADPQTMKQALEERDEAWATRAHQALTRNNPLAIHCALRLIRRSRAERSLQAALSGEYAFVSQSMEHGDFIEGIRAAIIDKDKNPKWRYPTLDAVPLQLIEQMLSVE